MFRKGGNVGVGIMSDITDRVKAQDGFLPGSTAAMKGAMGVTEQGINLANPLPQSRKYPDLVYENIDIDEMVGTPKTTEEYIAELQKGVGKYGGADPLTTFLLTAGPQVAKATGFADAISKLAPANKALLERLDKEAEYQRDLRLAGTKLGIGAEERAEQKRFDLKKLDLSEENQVKYLNDKRAYERMRDEDKKEYDQAAADKARKLAKLDERDRLAAEQNLINQGRAFELEKIKREENFQLKLLEKQTGIDNIIKEIAQKKYADGSYPTLSEATRKETWKVKTTTELRDQNLLVADEPLDPKVVSNPKKFASKARELGKKGNNVNRIYYDWTNDIQYRLEKDGKEYKFVVYDQGTETEKDGDKIKTTESVKEAIEKLPRRTPGTKGEEGEDESYEYSRGSAERAAQDRAIRRANIEAIGTIPQQRAGTTTINTKMNPQQKSDYDRFLEEYRNRN